MSLVDVPQLKDYLKVENSVEDSLISDLRASVIALIETLIGRPIMDPTGARSFGPIRRRYPKLRGYRVSDQAPNTRSSFIGTDALGRTTGLTESTTVNAFPALSTLDDYAFRWEPLVNQAIRDTLSDVFNHRNPGTQTETVGGGISTTYVRRVEGLPPRVHAMLQPIVNLGG